MLLLAKIIEQAGISHLSTHGRLTAEVTDITVDSRQCTAGWIFAAVKGAHQDGTAYVPDAIARGATVILTEDPNLPNFHPQTYLTWLVVPDVRTAIAALAAVIYAPKPAHQLAVTGTNGKTSTVHFCRQLWYLAGMPSASIGTLGVVKNAGELVPGTEGLTTPDVSTLHRWLHQLQQQGISHVAMEASSHGLHQRRMAGLDVKTVGFTNLSRDHLDYHGSMDEYLAAKMLIITELLQPGGTAVINADCDVAAKVLNIAASRADIRCITFGHAGKELQLQECIPTPRGQRVAFRMDGKDVALELPLIGDFQIENLLCALGMVWADGMAVDALLPLLPLVSGVPGRMQVAAHHHAGGAVIVDYAHTPDALERVLMAARKHVDAARGGRLHVVFGCGGDRDAGKRPIMGSIAAKLADVQTVTDDNPRTEDPASIRKSIMAACPQAVEIGDRADAIQHSINKMQAGDVLVIAGKGHEQVQIVGTVRTPFDDVRHAQLATGS